MESKLQSDITAVKSWLAVPAWCGKWMWRLTCGGAVGRMGPGTIPGRQRKRSAKSQPGRVGRNVQVEVHKTVHQNAADSHRRPQRQPSGRLAQSPAQIPEREPEERRHANQHQ